MENQTVTNHVATKTLELPAVDRLRDELGEIEMEVLTSYTLADAIREGSTVTKQEIGGWMSDQGENACALSAAYIAAKARNYIK